MINTSSLVRVACEVHICLHLPGGIHGVHVMVGLGGGPPLKFKVVLFLEESLRGALGLLNDYVGLLPVLDHICGAAPTLLIEILGVFVVLSVEVFFRFFLQQWY